MRNKYVFFLLAVFFISCAGTELKQEQVDESYKGEPLSNILVIAVTGNEHNRSLFEKKFVIHLKSAGVSAIASQESIKMPPDLNLEKDTILNAVNQYKNDAVIITQLISKEKEHDYTRSMRGHRTYFGYSTDPGYSSTTTTALLETNLYDAKTGKIIWSGKSKTLSRDPTDQVMDDVIRTVVNSMKENKLIATK